jgi:signal transduction histidine kinase/ActR/RegA family two-component response regulator
LVAAAGLFLGLTYLLVRGDAPDAFLHGRTLGAFHEILLADASLQRDVLRARAGLLGSYDPLVEAVSRLHRIMADLRSAGSVAEGATTAELAEQYTGLAAAVVTQEDLVEAFKSENALLQNSMRYFAHASDQLIGHLTQAPDWVAVDVAALGTAMHRFTTAPGPETAARLGTALDRVAGPLVPPPLGAELQALVPHGRLIVSTLPAVDGLLARILETSVAEQARALQESYLRHYGQAETRAELSRLLLYLASVLLLAYLGHLFLRLRTRLRFERLVAAIAAALVGPGRGEVADAIRHGLARLAAELGADRAYLLLPDADHASASGRITWQQNGLDRLTTNHWPEGALTLCERWGGTDSGHRDAITLSRVGALPTGPDRTALEELGVRAWLCVPIRRAGGERIGFLGFEALSRHRRWREDDIVLLRTVAEIFANALERERAAAKREMLEAELHRAQRMEAVGTLAGGIAHNFNNILGAIMGYAEMALDALPRDSRTWGHVREIWKAGERARGVIAQVLAFSRRGHTERRPVRMPTLCQEAVSLLRASLPATVTIELRVEAAATEAVVQGDPNSLQLVVVNLCTNGAQAMDGRGVLVIRLDTAAFDRELALSHGALAPGRYLRLAVTDTGHGIDRATAERIFEPFFTTKDPGRGTGLGLAMTHAAVTDHGGGLNLLSRPGEGSTFEVYLPLAEVSAETDDHTAPASVPRGSGEVILLVDDDRTLVRLGEEMLAMLGYEPVGFDSAARALAAFRADPRRFDLVLTDEVMPEMTGTEFAAELHRISPDLPVILMTGHGGPVRTDHLHAAGIREVLRKPLTSRGIAEAFVRHLCSDTIGGPGSRAEA